MSHLGAERVPDEVDQVEPGEEIRSDRGVAFAGCVWRRSSHDPQLGVGHCLEPSFHLFRRNLFDAH